MKELLNKLKALIMKSTLSKAITVVIVLAVTTVVTLSVNYFIQADKDRVALANDRERETEELTIVFDESKLNIDEESTFDYTSIIVSATGIVTVPEEELDTTVLGDVELIYIVTSEKYEDITKELTIVVTVVEIDKTPVIYGVEDITMTVGDKIDLLANVSAFDYKGNVIEPKVEGSYSTTKAGTYNLKYVAVDEAGNIQEESFVLTVNAKSGGSDGGNSGSGNNNNGGNSNNGGNNNNSNTGDNNNNNNGGTSYACPNAKHDPNIGCDEIPSHVDKGDEFFPGANAGNTCYYAYLDENGQGVNFPPGAKNYFCTPVENNMGNTGGYALHWIY